MATASIDPVLGLPGVKTIQTAGYRRVRLAGPTNYPYSFAVTNNIVNPALCYDAGNTPNIRSIRAGMPFGIVTASGRFATSFIGTVQTAYASGGTSLTVTPATAVVLNARIGASGTFKLAAPPTAAGVVRFHIVTYSAINTTTGVVTVNDIGADVIAGSMVMPNDGSEYPRGLLDDGYGMQCLDPDTGTSLSAVQFGDQTGNLLVSGLLDVSGIVGYPTDTSLKAWYKQLLNGLATGDTSLTLLTDNSGGDASNNTIAAITQAANTGSADVTPTADAIAKLAAKLREHILNMGRRFPGGSFSFSDDL